nr:glutamine synthetase [bacterium]
RIVPGFEAPCYISWSTANRSTMIRIPSARGLKTRAEVRSVDTTANPYLAASVLLRAGLSGIEGKCEHFDAIHTNLFACSQQERENLRVGSLPENLKEAICEFKKDTLMQEAIGKHLTNKLIEAKQIEWDEFRTTVTEWEINKYLKMF